MTTGRELWDLEAESFDREPDHGLADPECRTAWRDLLVDALPDPPARVADLGCGTGTLSLLLAEEGHDVTGVDFSPAIVRRARAKAGHAVTFHVADAADPPLEPAAYDVVLCRHVLWAMPSPAAALQRWIGLLSPGGRLVIVEGRWHTGGGLTGERTLDLVRSTGREAVLRSLPEAVYWGREVEDERYLVVSRTRYVPSPVRDPGRPGCGARPRPGSGTPPCRLDGRGWPRGSRAR